MNRSVLWPLRNRRVLSNFLLFSSRELPVCQSNVRSYYQTSDDRSLKTKQEKQWQKLTQRVYVQQNEVETSDGFKLVEPLIDENQKPHELHLIKKIGALRGEPWWVREALQKLGFNTKRKEEWSVVYNVQPNTAEVNNLLWLCKHLVRVTPVKFKNGDAQMTEKDLNNTRINLETGEFEIIRPLDVQLVSESVRAYKMNDVNVTEDLKPSSSFGLDKNEIMRHLHRQKELRQLNDEYFPAVYDYKYDQDKPGVLRLKGKPDTSILEDGSSDEPAL